MQRRHFLKLAIGFAAGAATLATGATAAPLSPLPFSKDERLPPGGGDVHPAVTSEAEVEQLKPEQIRWGHRGHHHHWRRRWRRWHHRHWHHRHW